MTIIDAARIPGSKTQLVFAGLAGLALIAVLYGLIQGLIELTWWLYAHGYGTPR